MAPRLGKVLREDFPNFQENLSWVVILAVFQVLYHLLHPPVAVLIGLLLIAEDEPGARQVHHLLQHRHADFFPVGHPLELKRSRWLVVSEFRGRNRVISEDERVLDGLENFMREFVFETSRVRAAQEVGNDLQNRPNVCNNLFGVRVVSVFEQHNDGVEVNRVVVQGQQSLDLGVLPNRKDDEGPSGRMLEDSVEGMETFDQPDFRVFLAGSLADLGELVDV
mmetsp:Transcript_23294/g.52308  ORF Transcript_23294/g.52308 Transcript_23294/m.52308 type:complete len:222 (-) Transcript_23294:1862-2527(-)